MRFRIVLIVAVFLFATLAAEACSCSDANRGGCEVPVADIILRATVVSIEVSQTRVPLVGTHSSGAAQRGRLVGRPAGALMQPLEPWKVTLSESELFRGVAGSTLVIRTGPGDCMYPFEVGHEYLIFGNGRQGDVTLICARCGELK